MCRVGRSVVTADTGRQREILACDVLKINLTLSSLPLSPLSSLLSLPSLLAPFLSRTVCQGRSPSVVPEKDSSLQERQRPQLPHEVSWEEEEKREREGKEREGRVVGAGYSTEALPHFLCPLGVVSWGFPLCMPVAPSVHTDMTTVGPRDCWLCTSLLR